MIDGAERAQRITERRSSCCDGSHEMAPARPFTGVKDRLKLSHPRYTLVPHDAASDRKCLPPRASLDAGGRAFMDQTGSHNMQSIFRRRSGGRAGLRLFAATFLASFAAFATAQAGDKLTYFTWSGY